MARNIYTSILFQEYLEAAFPGDGKHTKGEDSKAELLLLAELPQYLREDHEEADKYFRHSIVRNHGFNYLYYFCVASVLHRHINSLLTVQPVHFSFLWFQQQASAFSRSLPSSSQCDNHYLLRKYGKPILFMTRSNFTGEHTISADIHARACGPIQTFAFNSTVRARFTAENNILH